MKNWRSGGNGTRVLAVVVALGSAGVLASGCSAPSQNGEMQAEEAAPSGAGAALCNGTFSDGKNPISVSNPAYLPDVPLTIENQTVCDVHTFAWNQFLYYTQMAPDPNNGNQVTPRFLHMAPWYNALKTSGSPAPGKYPGGNTSLQVAHLDQGQAGTDDRLVDVDGNTVLYDIRFDVNMYESIVLQNLYTEALFVKACEPDPATGVCANNDKIWMSPAGANEKPEPGSIEIKTAWRDFGTPAGCPQDQYYCNGRFGLVGLHYVNKTFSHGEWIWASFEHVANDPDCAAGGESPIAPLSPIGTAWAFFDPATAGPDVMNSKTCNVASSPPQCNGNPNPSGDKKTYVQTNICRTDNLPAGGASADNCKIMPADAPQYQANNGGNVACLNASIMPQREGAWKNYKLIGTLWTSGGMGPNQDFRIKIFQQEEQGIPYAEPAGFEHLASTTMETWLQKDSTGYDPFGINGTQAGCFLCHNLPSAYGNGNRQVDLSHFPGKLPPATLTALHASLLGATATEAKTN